MNFKFIKKRMVVVMLAGAIFVPTMQVFAADAASILTRPKKTEIIETDQKALTEVTEARDNNKELEPIESKETKRIKKVLSGRVFAVVGDAGYLPVYQTTDVNSVQTGKVYKNSLITITEKNEDWSAISSGNVVGYVQTADLFFDGGAVTQAQIILKEKYPETKVEELTDEVIADNFSVGETVEEETARIEAEIVAKRQEIVEYGKQFIGNPYVYGGTSLTKGTDCSGFVSGVYEHFGISLPHSSYSMRGVGRAVSYEEIQPGDIICYPGHVGIYAGNGQIVNAIGDREGIGMSNAKYTKIVTIRRIF